MASVLPRGISHRGKLFHIVVHYRGHEARATEPTLYLAEIRKGQLLEALISERPTGVPAPNLTTRPWTLEHAYDRTSEVIWLHSRDAKNAMKAAREAVDHFGRHTLVRSITSHMIDHWTQALRARRLSHSSINRRLCALSRMIRFTCSRGGAEKVPVISRLKATPGRTRYLTKVEEARIFNILETRPKPRPDDPACIRLLLDTGMRVSEMMALTEADVDFERDLILVWRNKGNKPRAIPMTGRVRKLLRDRSKGDGQRRYFPHCYRYYNRLWKFIRQRMGLRRDEAFVMHCLRHTCASRLIHQGVHLLTVKEWMGHKSLAATMRYIHLAPHDLQAAAKSLEADLMRPWAVSYEGSHGGWRSPSSGW